MHRSLETESLSVISEGNRRPLKTIMIFQNQGVGLLIFLVAMIIAFSLLSPYFLSLTNMLNILQSVAFIGIASIGMTLVILSGALDLSVGSVIGIAGVAVAILIEGGLAWPLAVLVGLASGVVVGAANGVIVTRLRINAIIATLGTLSIVRGIAFITTQGFGVSLNNPDFRFLGQGNLFGIPFPIIIVVILYAIAYFVLNYTEMGRYVYAIGGNPVASRLAGINVVRYQQMVFIISGLTAALSGIVFTSMMGAALPEMGMNYELNVITAVILGGASLHGGKGTIQGTVLGVLVMGTLDNGLVLLNVPVYYQYVARGLLLLAAVVIDQLRLKNR